MRSLATGADVYDDRVGPVRRLDVDGGWGGALLQVAVRSAHGVRWRGVQLRLGAAAECGQVLTVVE